MKSCCIIGHRKVYDKINFEDIFVQLIEKENINIFNFGNYGEFNDLSYEILLKLKFKYPQIKIIFYSLNNEVAFTFEEAERYKIKYENQNKIFPYKCFDEIIYLNDIDETKFKLACVLRNKKIVDESRSCLIYYRENYFLPNNSRSGTKIIYDYATKRKKKIFII